MKSRAVMIAAIARGSRVIGASGRMPWRVPGDARLFRARTMGRVLLMGTRTLESLRQPLDGRRLVVISRSGSLPQGWRGMADEVLLVSSPTEAMEQAAALDPTRPPIIAGGGQIYRAMLDVADTLWLTTFALDAEGDTFFPDVDMRDWELTEREHRQDNDDPCAWVFEAYSRRTITEGSP